MRKGMDGLAALVQTTLAENPFSGHIFVFRGRRGDLVKLLWFDGDGMCLYAKRLERGRFVWPQAMSGSVALSAAQLAMGPIRNFVCEAYHEEARTWICRRRSKRSQLRHRPPHPSQSIQPG